MSSTFDSSQKSIHLFTGHAFAEFLLDNMTLDGSKPELKYLREAEDLALKVFKERAAHFGSSDEKTVQTLKLYARIMKAQDKSVQAQKILYAALKEAHRERSLVTRSQRDAEKHERIQKRLEEKQRKESNPKLQELWKELNEKVGLDDVKVMMQRLVAQVEIDRKRRSLSSKKDSKKQGSTLHMAFRGNPGTGKTDVARIVGEILAEMEVLDQTNRLPGSKVVKEVSRVDLISENYGQTAGQVEALVRSSLGGVLFIDEAYSVSQGNYGKEAVDALIKLMEDHRHELVVIVAGYDKEMEEFFATNAGFNSRVNFHFAFNDYSCEELMKISGYMLRKKGAGISTSAHSFTNAHQLCTSTDNDCHLKKAWFKAAVKFTSGCCEDGDVQCMDDRKDNRANGNGRTVRNILEASYRHMADRVMSMYASALWQTYSETTAERFTPTSPKLHCGELFLDSMKHGPYESMSDLNKHRFKLCDYGPGIQGADCLDLRCAFNLLDETDFVDTLGSHLYNQLYKNCNSKNQAMFINVTERLDELRTQQHKGVQLLDWGDLHTLVFAQESCKEAQDYLNTGKKTASSLVEHTRTFQVFDASAVKGNGVSWKHKSALHPKVEEKLQELESLVGLKPIKDSVRGVMKFLEFDRWRKHFKGQNYSLVGQSLHMQFLGNPGTGKTVVARIVGELLVALEVLKQPEERKPKECEKRGEPDYCVYDRKAEGGRTVYGPQLMTVTEAKSKCKEIAECAGFYIEGKYKDLKKQDPEPKAEATLKDRWNPPDESKGKFIRTDYTSYRLKKRIPKETFHEASRADLVAQYLGQTAKKVQNVVRNSFGGVLFIDEAYTLVQRYQDSFGLEAVAQLIKDMEDHRDMVVVIFAGYTNEMEEFFESNPGLASRVPLKFQFPDYTCAELLEIAHVQNKKQHVEFGSSEPWIAKVTGAATGCCTQEEIDAAKCKVTRENGNGRTVRNVMEASLRKMSSRVVKEVLDRGLDKERTAEQDEVFKKLVENFLLTSSAKPAKERTCRLVALVTLQHQVTY
eukprot:gnl/MRDRNA2_/MRDRNA2_79318_c0_seq1.p1 gnl/MRDRNA2_/MRDRNA2_79318_c0~~gnl/MRDRNA2_/MRDRNA2_79318_c0_seq1.p1  ORF type:complete len:1109 (-),score=238.67 gnl/MRDRNA2_/MRDRNA2_79318_c0_seq1:1596-4682(-)